MLLLTLYKHIKSTHLKGEWHMPITEDIKLNTTCADIQLFIEKSVATFNLDLIQGDVATREDFMTTAGNCECLLNKGHIYFIIDLLGNPMLFSYDIVDDGVEHVVSGLAPASDLVTDKTPIFKMEYHYMSVKFYEVVSTKMDEGLFAKQLDAAITAVNDLLFYAINQPDWDVQIKVDKINNPDNAVAVNIHKQIF